MRRFTAKPFVHVNTDDVGGADGIIPLSSNFQTVTGTPIQNTFGALQAPAECELSIDSSGCGCSDPNCHSNATSSHCTCDGGTTYF